MGTRRWGADELVRRFLAGEIDAREAQRLHAMRDTSNPYRDYPSTTPLPEHPSLILDTDAHRIGED